MASTRAADVAEVLWELKRAEKVGTFSVIARRAGFSAGAKGKALQTALRTVRRDWPHLQWWRAISDDGILEKSSEHEEKLREAGFEFEDVEGEEEAVHVLSLEEHVMSWDDEDAGESDTVIEDAPATDK